MSRPIDKYNNFKAKGLAFLRDDFSESGRAVVVARASTATPELINELVSLTGGLTFVALSPERAASFRLKKMSPPPGTNSKSAAVQQYRSVEAREGVTTGISAYDRSETIKILGDKNPNFRKLVSPGHIFPVEAKRGGVLVRIALPEGALELVNEIEKSDAALFLDLLDDAGDFLSPKQQDRIAKENSIPIFLLSEITEHALMSKQLVSRVASAKLPTKVAGELMSHVYKSEIHEGDHIALVKGEITGDAPVLTRVQVERTLTDVFREFSPKSREQIEASLKAISDADCGVFLYLRSNKRGQLKEQVQQSAPSKRKPTAAEMREYGMGAQILRDLGVRRIELLSGSARHITGLETFGIQIISHRSLEGVK